MKCELSGFIRYHTEENEVFFNQVFFFFKEPQLLGSFRYCLLFFCSGSNFDWFIFRWEKRKCLSSKEKVAFSIFLCPKVPFCQRAARETKMEEEEEVRKMQFHWQHLGSFSYKVVIVTVSESRL